MRFRQSPFLRRTHVELSEEMQEGSQVRGCSSAWKMISAHEMKSGRLSVLAFEVGLPRRPTAAPKAPVAVPTVWMGTSWVGACGREEPRFVRGVGLPHASIRSPSARLAQKNTCCAGPKTAKYDD